jgi:hypothetical protein
MKAMREIAVGVGVSIFIALFIIYVYDPTLFEIWVRRLFFD